MESSAKVPLCKGDNSNNNEKLHFPTTGFIEFIQYTTFGNNRRPEELRRLKSGSRVLPHLQLWKGDTKFCIDNDLKSIHKAYHCASNDICFDVLQDRVITVKMFQGFYIINLIDLNINKEGEVRRECKLKFADRGPWYCDLVSLCFHHGISPWLFSICKRYESEELSEQNKLMLFVHRFDVFVPTTIKIPKEISLITKHEYIGANTFLLLAANQLFFGVYDNDTKNMIFSKQKILTQKGEEWQELEVLSFSANQDENKKTLAGRTRYFAFVVQEPCDNGSGLLQKKLLLCDLLNLTNTLLKIWQADFNEQNVDFDRISFGNDTLSLWNDDWSKKDAMKISLDKNWDNNFEWSLLVVSINKMGKLTDLIQSLKTDAKITQAIAARIDFGQKLCNAITLKLYLESLSKIFEEKRNEKRYFRLRMILSACCFVVICCLIFKLRQLSINTIY